MKKKDKVTISKKKFNKLAKAIIKYAGPPTICFDSEAAKQRFLLRQKMMEVADEAG